MDKLADLFIGGSTSLAFLYVIIKTVSLITLKARQTFATGVIGVIVIGVIWYSSLPKPLEKAFLLKSPPVPLNPNHFWFGYSVATIGLAILILAASNKAHKKS